MKNLYEFEFKLYLKKDFIIGTVLKIAFISLFYFLSDDNVITHVVAFNQLCIVPYKQFLKSFDFICMIRIQSS